MKGRIMRSLLGILFVCSLLVLGTAAQEPATMVDHRPPILNSRAVSSIHMPSGITNIGESTVNYVSPSTIVYAIDFQYDLCFNVTVASDDFEYMDHFDVDLPDYWSVISVYPVAPSPTGCQVSTIAGVEAGNVVYWQRDRIADPSGCGPWDGGTYDFCARIDVPGCFDDPWSLSWNIIGDGWGEEPHQVSGTTNPLDCLPAGLYLNGDTIFGESCQGFTNNIVLNLENHTGAEGTFNLAYDVSTDNGTLSGPDQIYLGPGIDQYFEVNLTPQACLRQGELVEATVIAEGNGFADITYISLYIKEDETCTKCQSTYLPCILKQH